MFRQHHLTSEVMFSQPHRFQLRNDVFNCTDNVVVPFPKHSRHDRTGRDQVFVVEGDRAGRLVQVTDMKDPDSLFSLFQRLRAMGVIDALINEGVTPGAEVVINGFSFTYGEGLN